MDNNTARKTDTEERIYQYLCGYIKENKIAPTVREMCEGTGLKSTATINKYINLLKEKGKIRCISNSARSIVLTEQEDTAPVKEAENPPVQEEKAVPDGTQECRLGEIVYQATIPLTPITKKNSQEIRLNKRTGARWIAQSKQYTEYASKVGWYLPASSPEIDYPVNVQMIFYIPDNRRVDLSNLQSACLDILTDYKVLKDDNCRIVARHDFSRVVLGAGKDNGKTEIIIRRIIDGDPS